VPAQLGCKKHLAVRPPVQSLYLLMETGPGEVFGCRSGAADSGLWECDTVLLGKWFLVF
jgi:hypothetical protein